jgi:indolepyruvate ferredoxin oxidoreductase
VVTHLKIAQRPQDLATIRIAAGGSDLILGCDLVTSASERVLATADPARTFGVVNSHEIMPAQFTRSADLQFPAKEMSREIESRLRPQGAHFVDSTLIATELLGDSIASNMFTMGYAYQEGLIPIGAAAIERAIELNGVSVKLNLDAFLLGRRAAHDPELFASLLKKSDRQAETLDELIERRSSDLIAYQDAGYARGYRALVEEVRRTEDARCRGSTALTEAVARYYYKLLAYKDEYEVARLYTDGEFRKELEKRFKGGRLKFHLAPPLLASRDLVTGHLRKRAYGPWMMKVFELLAKFKFLRGTAFDPFGYSAERKQERDLIREYEQSIQDVLAGLNSANHELAVEIASVPQMIRGFGHVKERHLAPARKRWLELITAYRAGRSRPAAIAAE